MLSCNNWTKSQNHIESSVTFYNNWLLCTCWKIGLTIMQPQHHHGDLSHDHSQKTLTHFTTFGQVWIPWQKIPWLVAFKLGCTSTLHTQCHSDAYPCMVHHMLSMLNKRRIIPLPKKLSFATWYMTRLIVMENIYDYMII
jgi:hypothetical protein